MALDVSYSDNLFISVTNQCGSISIYDLSVDGDERLAKKFKLGNEIVIDQIIFCETGDYLACVGHKNGILSVYTIFEWRTSDEPLVLELGINVHSGDQDRREKLNCIDCCQRTGNLSVSCGDVVLIYKFLGNDDSNRNEDTTSFSSSPETIRNDATITDGIDESFVKQHFKHIISIKLTIWALKIRLLENYLSITAVDHVQVLKLEILTLQIQSDGLDAECQAPPMGQASGSGSDPTNFNGAQSEATSTSTTIATSCSMASDSNSTRTNFSSLNNNIGEQLNNSDISIITVNQRHQFGSESDINGNSNQSADDCITWNLNTKKLVKLPTLMHNTSTNLSSYHICHPLELLGPASESIACRVSASIYSSDYCQNQLEAVVMLCKQFDFDRDPVKSTHLQAIYLSSMDDYRRLNKVALVSDDGCGCAHACASGGETLLKSKDYDLLTTVDCFISTLKNCFIYSLHGKKVVRTQTITHPDMCLDLRPDLLNVYLLTPLGLQICSSGVCDSTFHYDWSSSSDLNLSFIATDRMRVITTSRYVIMVACSVNGKCLVDYMEKPSLFALYDSILHVVNRCDSISIRSNLLTYLHATAQLNLSTSFKQSANPETIELLKSVTILLCKQLTQKKQTNIITNTKVDKAIKHLLNISMCDLAELMKRHLATRSQPLAVLRTDDSKFRHDNLSDFESSGDECRARPERQSPARGRRPLSCNLRQDGDDDDDDEPLDTDYELIKIYLKHAKNSQSFLDYLISNSNDESICARIIRYMFEHNPRLLIKCAQKYSLSASKMDELKESTCMVELVEKLKQLAEFDSTGINRATVLFTLASLYNDMNQKQKCLYTLNQIKPFNHLAITMCSNYELSHSMASLVHEKYPDVFELFLVQLEKRDPLAASEFRMRYVGIGSTVQSKGRAGEGLLPGWRKESAQVASDFSKLKENNVNLSGESNLGNSGEEGEEEEDDEIYETKLKLVAEIPTIELVDLLAPGEEPTSQRATDGQKSSTRALIEASINILESQFILARLRENSH